MRKYTYHFLFALTLCLACLTLFWHYFLVADKSTSVEAREARLRLISGYRAAIRQAEDSIGEEKAVLLKYDGASKKLGDLIIYAKSKPKRTKNNSDSVASTEHTNHIYDGGQGETLLGNGTFVSRSRNLFDGKTTILMLCFGRPNYLKRAFESLLRNLPENSDIHKQTLFFRVSQDGKDPAIVSLVDDYIQRLIDLGYNAEHWFHKQLGLVPGVKDKMQGYYKLSNHYKYALDRVFKEMGSRRVIILEDDMDIATDFFEYMGATSVLLDKDKQLMAVSAWNDNGQAGHAWDSERLIRTDFFPGLGWMMPKRVWDELSDIWPEAFWDDWLRDNRRRKGRHFIAPEISRTYNFGATGGASGGLHFQKYLQPIKLNDKFIPFTEKDLSYLYSENYDPAWRSAVEAATVVDLVHVLTTPSIKGSEYKLMFGNFKEYEKLAKALLIIPDEKDKVPRQGYYGVVMIRYRGGTLYLVPKTLPKEWKQIKVTNQEP